MYKHRRKLLQSRFTDLVVCILEKSIFSQINFPIISKHQSLTLDYISSLTSASPPSEPMSYSWDPQSIHK